MEASAIRASAGVHRRRVAVAAPLLRLRSDQQLVAQFRAGNEDAFRVIHDRYRGRLLAYVRQMLPGRHPDAEDTLQDVFVRAYAGLRAGGGEVSLRPWLYRIAHNRCVDAVRRPLPATTEPLDLPPTAGDPVAESEQRESLRRLVTDIRRLPDQQRSALLMRELGGVAYTDIAAALSVSVPAVKSLLVRARMGLAAALEARDTACEQIRRELALAHERGIRPSGIARRHLRDCPGCREYRSELRSVSRQFAALAPAIGPLGLLAKLLGAGGGAGGSAAVGGGALAAGGAAGAGGTVLGLATSHVAALVAAAVATAGGALELQRSVTHPGSPAAHYASPAPARAVDQAGAATAQPPAPVAQPRQASIAHTATVQDPPQPPTRTRPALLGRPPPSGPASARSLSITHTGSSSTLGVSTSSPPGGTAPTSPPAPAPTPPPCQGTVTTPVSSALSCTSTGNVLTPAAPAPLSASTTSTSSSPGTPSATTSPAQTGNPTSSAPGSTPPAQ